MCIAYYEIEAPTLTGFNLLKVFLANSSANTKRPKRYNTSRCSFSNMLRMEETLFPPSVFSLIVEVLVSVHPEKIVCLLASNHDALQM